MKSLSMQYESEHRDIKRLKQKPYIMEALMQKYESSYYGATRLQNFSDIKGRNDVICVAYDELPYSDIQGFPIGSYRNSAGKLEFVFSKSLPNTHTINVGTTGSGKTTGFVEPGIRAISSKKNKANMFITDPKGEIFSRNANHLKKMGYDLYVLNFKDVIHSHCWNPLAEIYDTFIKQKDLINQIYHIEGREALNELKLDSSCKDDDKEFWVFNGTAFPNKARARKAYDAEIANINSEVADLIHQIVHTLIPDTIISKNDPSWVMGAQDILSGLIYAMLEDSLDERSGFNRDNMNLMTVQDYFESIRSEKIGNEITLLNTRKLSHKTSQDVSIKQLRNYFENAPNTAKSYLGVFRNSMQEWFNNKVFTICNGNSFDSRFDSDKQFAIFLITRDFEKSDFTIAGLFIDWIYKKMLEAAEDINKKTQREMFFILDEFANIPPIKDFDSKIATARSRNIWFQLFIQSYSQLETVYSGMAQTILDNCNTHIFMGSQNYETKKRFICECGKQIIPTWESTVNPKVKNIAEVSLINQSKLDLIKPGSMFMYRKNMPICETEFIRSFLCDEFLNENAATPSEFGIISVPFTSEKYSYAFLKSSLDMANFAKTAKAKQEGLSDFPYMMI